MSRQTTKETEGDNRKRKYTPRGQAAYRALYLTGLLGFATVRQLCLLVWGSERVTNDNINRLLEHKYLHQAHEQVELAEGRGNRLVFLTRTGVSYVLGRGHLRDEDIAYYWRGEGHWHPSYHPHHVAVHDVLCAFIKQAGEHSGGGVDMRLDPQLPLGEEARPVGVGSPLQERMLLPDRVFALRHGELFLECYLEVDLGTEDRKQWREKMEKYLASVEVMEQEGVVVLVVANKQRRMETLLRWSEDLVDARFLFSHLDRVCYAYSRVGKELVLTRTGAPFDKVWRITSGVERELFEDAGGG